MSFENPESKFRGAPFWSLNGTLDKRELKKQIGVMKQMGFGGAFIHSRTGLATEYLSEEWFDDVAACVEEMKKEGMRAWLYDEDRWPSGTCGGEVTRTPRFRMKFLAMKLLEAEQFSMLDYGQEFVDAFALKLDGEPFSDVEELDPRAGMNLSDFMRVRDRVEVPDGWTVAVIFVEEMKKTDFYNGYCYVDTLNAEATRAFLDLTHEKYAEKFGPLFGREIFGMFTDEPHRGALLSGFGLENENRFSMLPYTYALFETYRGRWGEGLEDKLPMLWFRYRGDNFSRVMWQYVETLEQLFLDNFAKPCQDWCREHNLIMTGHILHEDSLACQTTMSGSMMRYYEYMDYPGMDNLCRDNSPLFVPMQVASVAKQFDKPFVLSELYGCTGWYSDFELYKQIGDWQANYGVNFRCPHLSWYTMEGEAKRDFPASILHQSGWYPEYHVVEDYFARLGEAFSGAKSLTSTLVVNPVESAWGLSHYGTYQYCFNTRDPEYQKLERDYADTVASLVTGQIDFDYGDEEIMSRRCSVRGEGEAARIVLGEMEYAELVLSGMINVRSATLTLAKEFLAKGGRVVFCGLPRYVDGNRADVSKLLSGYETCEISALGGLLGKRSSFPFKIEAGENLFLSACRKRGKDYLLFVTNFDRKEGHSAKIVLPGLWNVEKLNLRTGGTEGIRSAEENGDTVVRKDFALSEELFLRVTKENVPAPAPDVKYAESPAAEIPMKFSLNEDNVLVLDRASCQVDGTFLIEDEILKIDRAVRRKFGLRFRGGEMVQPWFQKKYFGERYGKKLCTLTLRFAFSVRELPKGVSLMLETPERFRVSLNGKPVDLHETRAGKIDRCFRLADLDDGAFALGGNVLEAVCDFSEDVNLESFYLLGGFGVKAGLPCELVKLPETLRFGDVTDQGLPFYSGNVTYRIPAAPGRYDVEAGAFSAACFKSGEKVAAFAPWVLEDLESAGELEVTAVLTRKNLFGPLHENPKRQAACGPDNFITTGDYWSDDYQLIDQGLLAPPLLKRREGEK